MNIRMEVLLSVLTFFNTMVLAVMHLNPLANAPVAPLQEVVYVTPRPSSIIIVPTVTIAPTLTPPQTPSPTATITPEPTMAASPTPTTAPLLIQKNDLCINYGHQTNKYDLSKEGQIEKDLANIQQAGIDCIRLAYKDWNYNRMLDLAMLTKTKGFRVILGGHYGTVTETDLAIYRTEVLEQAKWAEKNTIDQFSLGNEQEFKMTITKEQWHSFLTSLAAEVRTLYSGVISYEASGVEFDFWIEQDLGEIDMLGFNMYSGYAHNSERLQKFIDRHGKNRVYLSETNADMELVKFHNDQAHASEVAANTLKLLELGIPIYYFTYTACNDGVENYWGLFQCDILAQPKTAEALGFN